MPCMGSLCAPAAFAARLDVFFGIVPEPPGIGEEQRQQQAAYNIPQQKSADGIGPADQTDRQDPACCETGVPPGAG